MSEHYLSGDGVLRKIYSPEDEAIDVKLKNLELAIAVSADEGDSVFAIKKSLSVEPNTIVDVRGLDRVCIYAEGVLEVSPSDSGDDFITIPAQVGVPVSICARRLRCSSKVVVHG